MGERRKIVIVRVPVSFELKQSFVAKQNDYGVNFSIIRSLKIQSSFTIYVVDFVNSGLLSFDYYFTAYNETCCSGTLQVFVNCYLHTFSSVCITRNASRDKQVNHRPFGTQHGHLPVYGRVFITQPSDEK